MNQERQSDFIGALKVALSCEAIVVLAIFMGAVAVSRVGSIAAAIGDWVGQ